MRYHGMPPGVRLQPELEMSYLSVVMQVALTTENRPELAIFRLNPNSRTLMPSSTAPGNHYFRNLHSSGIETLLQILPQLVRHVDVVVVGMASTPFPFMIPIKPPRM